MDASGNAAKNQLKTTKSETATTPMQTAIRIQSRRVKRSIIQEVPSARSPVPSGTDDKRHWVLGTGHWALTSRQLLQRLLHPPDSLGRLFGRQIQRRAEANRLMPRRQNHDIVLHHRLDRCIAQIAARKIECRHEAAAATVRDEIGKINGKVLQL